MTLPDLGPHAGFIIASYVLFFATLAGMIGWIWIDGAGLARTLKDLDARGIRRRSAEAGPLSKDDA